MSGKVHSFNEQIQEAIWFLGIALGLLFPWYYFLSKLSNETLIQFDDTYDTVTLMRFMTFWLVIWLAHKVARMVVYREEYQRTAAI